MLSGFLSKIAQYVVKTIANIDWTAAGIPIDKNMARSLLSGNKKLIINPKRGISKNSGKNNSNSMFLSFK
jgi:hypothetical protein